jgi:hypothetical protein
MKDKLYPDTSVSENAQEQFFRWISVSLENGTRTPLFLIEKSTRILCRLIYLLSHNIQIISPFHLDVEIRFYGQVVQNVIKLDQEYPHDL